MPHAGPEVAQTFAASALLAFGFGPGLSGRQQHRYPTVVHAVVDLPKAAQRGFAIATLDVVDAAGQRAMTGFYERVELDGCLPGLAEPECRNPPSNP